MFKIGEILTKENYMQAAVWCNANAACIERRGEKYVIVKNAPLPEQTAEERVQLLEARYGMNRWQREGILAAPEYYSALVVERAREIERAAASLRAENL